MSILALSLFSIAEIEPTEHQETVMHDVNIEDMTKVEPSVLALSLFYSTQTCIHFQFRRKGHILKSSMPKQQF